MFDDVLQVAQPVEVAGASEIIDRDSSDGEELTSEDMVELEHVSQASRKFLAVSMIVFSRKTLYPIS